MKELKKISYTRAFLDGTYETLVRIISTEGREDSGTIKTNARAIKDVAVEKRLESIYSC